ncbi:hypothetical protein K7711_46590 [Nocardia sp. CA2R105]|uniref:DUF6602 domain-containing protein n=1 Tax=Nocardia coffeae TaxID=2873381 RepID=UPI001CA62A7D|nr:DUF6602 domain-containing protein [Nocardia coffeae]MBY8864001.1 hypothetical protein [Nocardia coffeae]
MASHDGVFAALDLRFRAALLELQHAYHHQSRGNEYEEAVRQLMASLVPPPYRVGTGLLDVDRVDGKQLDLVVHAPIPSILDQGSATVFPAEVILVAGEVKTNLADREDIERTAARLAAQVSGRCRLPFVIVAGRAEGHKPSWVADLVAAVGDRHPELWPAAFVLDGRPGGPAYAVLAVDVLTPLTAYDITGRQLTGVLTVNVDGMSPTSLLYLWLWAALDAQVSLPTLNYAFMRNTIAELTAKDPVSSLFRDRETGETTDLPVSFSLASLPASPVRIEPDESPELSVRPIAAQPELLETSRRVMLITLGGWVEQPDSWDETPWGGGLHTRSGHGFFEGMTQQQLLDAARVFWKFNPDSARWRDIDYAVVAHSGLTRAVIQIDRYVGPLWGRYGFRGRLVEDPELLSELVGKIVPRRQNPITTWN